jgi:protein TonB
MIKFIIITALSMFASTMFATHSVPSDTTKKITHHPKKKVKKKTVTKNNTQAVTTSTVVNTSQNNETKGHQHPNPLPIAPSYKDGQQAMLDFIKANVVVPQEVKKSGITITVNVAFTVGVDGKLKDIKVIKMVGMGCDEEALRVVKLMPEWNPGKVGRVATEMPFAIGVEFKN